MIQTTSCFILQLYFGIIPAVLFQKTFKSKRQTIIT